MDTIEIRNRFIDCILNIKSGMYEPLSTKKGRAFNALDDIPILLPMMCVPYVTADMIAAFYSDESDNDIVNKITQRYSRLCQKNAGEKYRFSERTYSSPVKHEDAKYRLQNVYSLTADGTRLLYDLCRAALSNEGPMHDALRPLLDMDEETFFQLRSYNQNASLTSHSLSRYHCMMMLYSLSSAAFPRDGLLLSNMTPDAFVRDIEAERAINPGFVRIPAVEKGALTCDRIPDLTMNYFSGGETSPVCVEIDQATERGAEIYSKVEEEIRYLIDNPGGGRPCAPVVLIAQYEGEARRGVSKKNESMEHERYASLLGKPGMADALLAYMTAHKFHCMKTGDSISLEEFIDGAGAFVAGTKIDKYPEDLKFILSFYEKAFYGKLDLDTFQEEYRINRYVERRTSVENRGQANRMYAKRQISSLRTRDDESGMHPLWLDAYEGSCIAACGRNEFRSTMRTLMPFEFSLGECLRVMNALSSSAGSLSLGRLLPSGSICRVEGNPGLSMRNIAMLKATDGSMGRRFCFEDLSSDLGAIYRLQEYVGQIPTGIAPDMMAVFLIDDDETLADGRKLPDLAYWEGPRFRQSRDSYHDRFAEAYGREAVSVPTENGIRNDFVFMKKSDFFAGDGRCHFYIRFGNWEIERTPASMLPQSTAMSFMKSYRTSFANLNLPGMNP